MGLLGSSISATKFNVLGGEFTPGNAMFRPIQEGSWVKESYGFAPFAELGVVAHGSTEVFQFVHEKRVLDKEEIKRALIREIQVFTEVNNRPPGAPTLRKMKQMVEEDLLPKSRVVRSYVDCYLSGNTLWAGTASSSLLGTLCGYLRRAGLSVEYYTPWDDSGESPDWFKPTSDPAYSFKGCEFLSHLFRTSTDVLWRSVKMFTPYGLTATLVGDIWDEDLGLLSCDGAIVSAKINIQDKYKFTLDATTFRVRGLKLPKTKFSFPIETIESNVMFLDSLCYQLSSRYNNFQDWASC